jgi:hypothetical protein
VVGLDKNREALYDQPASALLGTLVLHRKRPFLGRFGRRPKIPEFTHGMVFQKPSQKQSPKNPTPWMSYWTAAPRPDRSRAVLHINGVLRSSPCHTQLHRLNILVINHSFGGGANPHQKPMMPSLRGKRTPREGAGRLPALLLKNGVRYLSAT